MCILTTDTHTTDTHTTVIRHTDITQAHTTGLITMAHIRTGCTKGVLIIADMARIGTEHTEVTPIITDTPLVTVGTAIADITGDDMVSAMCQCQDAGIL